MEAEVAEIQRERVAESKKGGLIPELEGKVSNYEREIVKLNTQLEMKQGALDEEIKRVQVAQKALKELQTGIEGKRNAHEENVASFASIKDAYDVSTADLAKAEQLLQTLVTGLGANHDGDSEAAGGYMGQLAEAKAKMTAAQTEAEQAKVMIAIAEKEIKDKEPRAKKAAKEGEGLTTELTNAKKQLESFKSKVSELDWDEEHETRLNQAKSDLEDQIARLTDQRDILKSRLAAVDFAYSNPYPNFDRSKVKGLVANLIDLDASNHKASTALEISAGGRLYNVVVDDEKVGSSLLEKGQLRKRVTIIPLNKISAFRMSAEKLAAAEKIAPGKVNLALSLIGYDQDVAQAMAYVFGDTIIAADKETAQKVTFHPSLRVKSVTLDGDVYDPSGTLSGGAAPSSSGILVKVQELKSVEKKLAGLQAEHHKISKQLYDAKATIDTFRKAKRELDLKEHQVTLLEQQAQASNASKVSNDMPPKKRERSVLIVSLTTF